MGALVRVKSEMEQMALARECAARALDDRGESVSQFAVEQEAKRFTQWIEVKVPPPEIDFEQDHSTSTSVDLCSPPGNSF